MRLFLIILIYFASLYMVPMFNILIRDGIEVLLPVKVPQTTFWKVCIRSAHVSLINMKTVLATYEQEINQNLSQSNYQVLKTMVMRCLDPMIRARNF